MPDLNKLALAPEFNPHRQNVSVIDSTDDAVRAHGCNAQGADSVIASVKLESGTLDNLVLEPMYWSESAGKFVPDLPTAESGMAAQSQFTFRARGRIFWIKVKTMEGTAPVITINVAEAIG